jgi:1D-myo-inositol 3-kinase
VPAGSYLLIGEISADRSPLGVTLGGTVAYAAPVARAFGLDVRLLTSAARGEPLLANLRADISTTVLLGDATTSFENVYSSSGRAQILHARCAPIHPADVPAGWYDSRLVHIAPITNAVDLALATVFPNATLMITPQGWLREAGDDGRVVSRPWIDAAILRRANLVVLSREDMRDHPEMEARYAEATRHLVVTDGHQPGVFYEDGRAASFDVAHVDAVDVTGAGDVFATSLLCAYDVLGGDIGRAVQAASSLATLSVTREGYTGVPKAREVAAILESLP